MRSAVCGKAGFTLVEIMIVVALVALLAVLAIPNIVRARTRSQVNACINNLRQIDDASQQWGLENNKSAGVAVSFTDIQPYLKSAIICPSAGDGATFASSYTLATIADKPACNVVPGTHLLPPDTGTASRPPHVTPQP